MLRQQRPQQQMPQSQMPQCEPDSLHRPLPPQAKKPKPEDCTSGPGAERHVIKDDLHEP
jgi:hypothetical protein